MTDRKDTGPRIVTLIASATEIITSLGLGDRLVGISHECDYPPEVLHLPRLSAPKVDPELSSAEIDRGVREIVRDGLSVYRVDVETLARLEPDAIVTQDHCEVCAVSLSDVEDALCSLDLPHTAVHSLHPGTWEEALADIDRLGTGLSVPEAGRRVVEEMRGRLRTLSERTENVTAKSVALIEWLAPPMIAGGWMPELATAAGGRPVIVEDAHRFATVDWPDVAAADPEHVVILPCGFDLQRSLQELEDAEVAAGMRRIPAVREGRCTVVDGNAYFNRPGPRLADSAELLAGILHPEIFPEHVERFAAAQASWS